MQVLERTISRGKGWWRWIWWGRLMHTIDADLLARSDLYGIVLERF